MHVICARSAAARGSLSSFSLLLSFRFETAFMFALTRCFLWLMLLVLQMTNAYPISDDYPAPVPQNENTNDRRCNEILDALQGSSNQQDAESLGKLFEMAVNLNCLTCCRRLLSDFNVSLNDAHIETQVLTACTQNKLDFIELFLTEFSYGLENPSQIISLLMAAMRSRSYNVLTYLVHTVDWGKIQSWEVREIAKIAVQTQDSAIADLIVHNLPLSKEHLDLLLPIAAKHGDPGVFRTLLTHGSADVNSNGFYAGMVAAANGHEDLLEPMLSHASFSSDMHPGLYATISGASSDPYTIWDPEETPKFGHELDTALRKLESPSQDFQQLLESSQHERYSARENQNECQICMDKAVSCAQKPCNHELCSSCLSQINECPFCRREVLFSLPLDTPNPMDNLTKGSKKLFQLLRQTFESQLLYNQCSDGMLMFECPLLSSGIQLNPNDLKGSDLINLLNELVAAVGKDPIPIDPFTAPAEPISPLTLPDLYAFLDRWLAEAKHMNHLDEIETFDQHFDYRTTNWIQLIAHLGKIKSHLKSFLAMEQEDK